jgi:hypothetical protein
VHAGGGVHLELSFVLGVTGGQGATAGRIDLGVSSEVSSSLYSSPRLWSSWAAGG